MEQIYPILGVVAFGIAIFVTAQIVTRRNQ